jgi:hypothetical protein
MGDGGHAIVTRICVEPGCGTLVEDGSRCPDHPARPAWRTTMRGAEERSVALAPAELVEVTRFGAAEPEFIPTMWRWPFPCSPMD